MKLRGGGLRDGEMVEEEYKKRMSGGRRRGGLRDNGEKNKSRRAESPQKGKRRGEAR